MQNILTHNKISISLCGRPVEVLPGFSRVILETTEIMAVDDSGLVHGGFLFGLADHAAMIAVNHPNVVLAGAEVKFLKPVKTGETITAEAKIISEKDKKRTVDVIVIREGHAVFSGTFICAVTDRHVLK